MSFFFCVCYIYIYIKNKIKMGANTSSQTSKQISSVVNESLNRSITTMSTSVVTQTDLNQSINVSFQNSTAMGFRITQDGRIAVNTLTKLSNSAMKTLSNEIENKLLQAIDQGSKQKNSGINLGQVNTSIQNQEMKTFVRNNIQNIIETNINNAITNRTSGSQTISVSIINSDFSGVFELSQYSLIENISNNIAKNVVKETMSNKAITESDQKGSQSNTQENVGLNFGFGGIFLFFFAMVAYGVYKMRNQLMIFKSPLGILLGIGLLLMAIGTIGIVMGWFDILISSSFLSVGVLFICCGYYLYRTRYRQQNVNIANTNTNTINILNPTKPSTL